MRKVRYYLVNILVLLAFFSEAQEIKFTASVSKNKVVPGELFTLSYSVNTNVYGFNGPDLSAFDVYQGPNQTSSFSVVNGQMTQSFGFSYKIAARKTGKFTISPASIRVGNGQIQSNAIEIEVGTNPVNQSPNQSEKSHSASAGNTNENLFIKAIVSKSTTYMGEPVTVTYKVYNRYPMVNFSDVKIPSFNGFYTEEISIPRDGKSTTEVINGIQYTTAEVKKSLLIPQKSGKLEIPTLDATFLVRERVNSQNIFDQLFGGTYRESEVKVKSKPLVIDVLPLPASAKPADFSGGVGQFTWDVSVSNTRLKSGDACNLKIVIQGKGNLKLLENPVVSVPSEIELYDPQVKESVQVSANGMTGSKTFEYLMIPQAGGNYTIGPFSFSYFDPQRNSYQILTSPAIRLEVEKSSGEQQYVSRSGSKGGTKVIASDIRFNKTLPGTFIAIGDRGFLFSKLFYLLVLLPPISVIIFLVFRKNKERRLLHGAFYRKREAGTYAKKRLRHAKEMEVSGKIEPFYDEIFKALYGYLSDKLQIPVADLNREMIKSRLLENKVSTELQENLFKVLDNCEMARYAPSAVAGMREVYQQTAEVITELENVLKS